MKVIKPQFAILLILVSFGSVGAVLFTPALPSIESFFNVSIGKAQFTVTAYLIGYAFGQLPYGPLANRLGRKKTLYVGLSLAIIGSLLCALSASFESFGMLIFARVVQALGACVGLKISYTMIADTHEQTEATKMISRILLSFAIMPSIAVAIGGYLTQEFGWQSCFYFLAFFGLAAILLATRLPETAKRIDKQALEISSIYRGYKEKFRDQRLIISGLLMGCGSSVVYIFASKAPFIGIALIGLSPEEFGMFNLLPLIGMISGAFLATWAAGRYHFLSLILFGILASLLSTSLILVPFAMSTINQWTLFLPMIVIYIVEALVFSNASAFGLSTAKNKSNASAVLNFINLGLTVLAVFLSGIIYPESALLMPICFAALFLIMLLLWFRVRTQYSAK